MNNIPTYLGNKELLKLEKVGFLASRKISTLSVIPTFDWAIDVSKKEEVAVVSGFQSHIEGKVLELLLKGQCGIIIILNRGIYKRIPQKYLTAFNQNRVLFISLENDKITRSSNIIGIKRNHYIAKLADEVIFSSLSLQSSLYEIYSSIKSSRKVTLL